MARTRARCPVCQRGPYQLGNLYDHLRFVHWWSKEKVDQLKLKIKNTKFEGRFGIECECGKIYYSQHGIRVHRERMHGVPLGRSANYFPVTCPACHSLFRTGEELAIHCDEKHRKQGGQDFSMIQGTFRTHDDFEEWIDSVERLTKVEFTKRTSRLCKDGRNHIFVCKHSRGKGAAVDPKEIRQRFKKSERVHSHCPAFIRVIENMDGSVSYRGCLGHLGHKVGLEKSEQNPKEKSKRWQTHRRHKDALLYYSSRLDSCVSELSDDTWAVQAEDGFEYTVVVGDPCECGEDNTHCDRCGACPYQIICNCSDVAQKKGVSCIHAHAIAIFIDKAHQRIPSVQHYLATEMPGCSSASSEHDESAPPLLDSSEDMGDSDDDEHYEDNLSREEKEENDHTRADTPPQLVMQKKPIPKVTVELLRPTFKGKPPHTSSPLITLREEAKEELEQFQGLDEKQHVMVNTCMQSRLPHIIRDIRSTIESKMSEIVPAGVEKTPKTRLQNPSRFIQQEEAGPSTSSKQGECPSQQPNQSRENKIPATRKVLRREFLEARSSRIRLSDEDQKEVLRIRTQREQNQQVVAQPVRKVLKREFVEASTSRCRLLSDNAEEDPQSVQQQSQEEKNEHGVQELPILLPAKVLRRELVEATPSMGPLLKKQSELGSLPPGYRRVVRQTVITQGGRRVVKRVVVRRPILPSEKALIDALEQSTTDGHAKNEEDEGIELPNEGIEVRKRSEEQPRSSRVSEVAEENQEIAEETAGSSNTVAEVPFASVTAVEAMESNPEIILLKEGPAAAGKTLCEESARPSTAAKSTEDVSYSPEEDHRTESETSKDGARVVKKIYTRRGSEWVLKRLVIRPANEHDRELARSTEMTADSNESNVAKDSAADEVGTSPTKNGPCRVIRRTLVKRAAMVEAANDDVEQNLEVKSPSDNELGESIHKTPDLIQKSLTTALTAKSGQHQARTEILCLMCGKAEPPEHSNEEQIFWMGCSNAKKCHVRAHEKCLRAARARCFVCHAGTWIRVLVKNSTKQRLGVNTRSANKAASKGIVGSVKSTNGDKTPQSPAGQPTDERSPALCEVNS